MQTEEPSSSPSPEILPLGTQLQQLREDKSLSLEDVAYHTKVSRVNLAAIESMAYDKLPADSFTRGQIILYGNFLGMDGRLAADRFFAERDGSTSSPLSSLQQSLLHQPLTPKKLAEPTHISSASIAGVLLLLIASSLAAFCLYFSWNPLAFLTSRMSSHGSNPTTFHPADPSTSNGSAQGSIKMTASFRKDSRVLVSLDSKQPVEQFYTRGSQVQWQSAKQLEVEFFEPDSAELHLNGAPASFPDSVEGRFRLRIPAAKPSP